MKNVAEVLQLCTECLANSLMAKADAEDRLLAGISFNHIEQQAGLRGNARSWRENNLTVGLDFVETKLVVA